MGQRGNGADQVSTANDREITGDGDPQISRLSTQKGGGARFSQGDRITTMGAISSPGFRAR